MVNLSDIYNRLNLPSELKGKINQLLDEGFAFSGIMAGGAQLSAPLEHSGNEDCAFISCEDLENPKTWVIQRGHKDLEVPPPKKPLLKYEAPRFH